MNTTGRVVVAVDGTEGSAGALRYAAQEAARRGALLRIVHVSPTYVPLAPMLPDVPTTSPPQGTRSSVTPRPR